MSRGEEKKTINRIKNIFPLSEIFLFLGQLTPSNLTAYVVNAHTLSVTWDLPSNVNAIDKIYINVIEIGQKNRTIQSQSFDNTIKKLDIQINANDPFSK
jgi:hypothetical protein